MTDQPTAGADLYQTPEKYNRGGEDCTGSTSSDGDGERLASIHHSQVMPGPSEILSPDTARVDREALRDAFIENIYLAMICEFDHPIGTRAGFNERRKVAITYADAILSLLSKGGGTKAGSEG